MDKFKSLFGLPKTEIQSNCVITPFLAPKVLNHFGIQTMSKGFLCSTGQTKNITLIKTHMGPLFVGDAILQLKDTPCKNIFFLGSCGLVNTNKGLSIGSVVFPETSYPIESFTDVLMRRLTKSINAEPDRSLLSQIRTGNQSPAVSCVSFGSLELEENYLAFFNKFGIDVIEMECAAAFNAATVINKRAVAVLYISDIPTQKSFWQPLSVLEKKSLANGIRQACLMIKKCVEDNSN